jgi:hypothetical protein
MVGCVFVHSSEKGLYIETLDTACLLATKRYDNVKSVSPQGEQ